MRQTQGARSVRLWGPVVLYAAVIAWLSHQPSLSPPLGLPDWPLHIAEYAGLGAVTARALARTRVGLGLAGVAVGLGACALNGVLDEFHQSFVPGRDASARDVMADIVGAGLAMLAGYLMARAGSRRGETAMVEIRLFGRHGCHLCDEAEKVIAEVCAPGGVSIDGVRVEKVDVDSDAALAGAYGDQVPVITINGRKHFKHRVEPERLRRVLASMGRTGRRS